MGALPDIPTQRFQGGPFDGMVAPLKVEVPGWFPAGRLRLVFSTGTGGGSSWCLIRLEAAGTAVPGPGVFASYANTDVPGEWVHVDGEAPTEIRLKGGPYDGLTLSLPLPASPAAARVGSLVLVAPWTWPKGRLAEQARVYPDPDPPPSAPRAMVRYREGDHAGDAWEFVAPRV